VTLELGALAVRAALSALGIKLPNE